MNTLRSCFAALFGLCALLPAALFAELSLAQVSTPSLPTTPNLSAGLFESDAANAAIRSLSSIIASGDFDATTLAALQDSLSDLGSALVQEEVDRAKQKLITQIQYEDWPSDRTRDALIESVQAFGTAEMVDKAHHAAVYFAADSIRAAAGESEVEQNIANAIAKYVEAGGLGGGAAMRAQLLADIDKHITDPQARQSLRSAVLAVGKEGTDYLKLAESVGTELAAEGINRLPGVDDETKAKMISAIRDGEEIDWSALGDGLYDASRQMLAAQITELLNDKLGKKEATALSNILNRLILAGTDEAAAQVMTEIKTFVSNYAPGDSAADINAWIDSFGNDNLTDKQKEQLRTQAFKSATTAFCNDQIDKSPLSAEEKAKRKAEVAQQIAEGDYTGAVVNVGAVMIGTYVEEKAGPGSGEAATVFIDTLVDPTKSLGDALGKLGDLGIIVGKNYLNKVAGEAIDRYLDKHPNVGKALAFFGLTGDDLKAGISNTLNILTDKTLSFSEKFKKLAELAVEKLKQMLTTALKNLVNKVKELVSKWIDQLTNKLKALIVKWEAKINRLLRKVGCNFTVGFSEAGQKVLTLLQQQGTKLIHSKLDLLNKDLSEKINNFKLKFPEKTPALAPAQ